jgi:CAAX protease family protein
LSYGALCFSKSKGFVLFMGLFFNHDERRLRAFWRLLIQLTLFVAGSELLGLVALGLFIPWSAIFFAAYALLTLLVALGSVWLAGRFLDRRTFFVGFGLQIGNGAWWLDLAFGLFLGALLMTGIFLVELEAGWIKINGSFEGASIYTSFFPAIVAPIVLFFCTGISEELVFRGYQLKNIAEGLNFSSLGPKRAILLAWILSSSVFGLLHLTNPNATAISAINIAVTGLLLGVGYLLTGRLAISIGLHMSWNFFEGNVFGFPVSGLEPVGAQFISIEQGGPLLWTGGAFGPEAGLVDIAVSIAGSLLIVVWVRARSGRVALQTSLAEPPTSEIEVHEAPLAPDERHVR